MKNRNNKARGAINIRVKVEQSIYLKKLSEFLANKELDREERDYIGQTNIVNVSWAETDRIEWGGILPTISMEFDEKNAFLLSVQITYPRRQGRKKDVVLNAHEVEKKFFEMLLEAEIFTDALLVEHILNRETILGEKIKSIEPSAIISDTKEKE